MWIDAIRFQGYRSLRDVEFRPGSLTCLVGANGAGKSNMVAAFNFVRNVYGEGLQQAVLDENGFDAMAWRGADISDTMAFTVEARVPMTELTPSRSGADENGHSERWLDEMASLAIRHRFALERRSEGVFSGYAIADEVIEIFPPPATGKSPLVRGSRSDDGRSYKYAVRQPESDLPLDLLDSWILLPNEGFPLARSLRLVERQLAIASHRFFSPPLESFVGELSRIRSYRVSPDHCRFQGSPLPDGMLSTNGLGLPTAVAGLQKRYPAAWEDVLEAFFQLVPALADVVVEREYDGQLMLRFLEEEQQSPWLTTQISDGTLRSLALLVAVFDPRYRFILIEEPENSLHPWAIRVILDACRKATDSHGKQIVLTTHSPIVVDRMRPDQLQVVWREGGETHLRPLTERDPDIARLWEEGAANLSTILASGWIRESVPLFAR